jgi:hypothetical protein
MLSGACDGAANESTSWGASVFPGFASFQFLTVHNVLVGPSYPQLYISTNGNPADALNFADGRGSWTIVAATPEPSTAIWTTGLVALGLAVRKRAASHGRSA